MSEANEGLHAGSWSGTTGHSLCAWCWVSGVSVSCERGVPVR